MQTKGLEARPSRRLLRFLQDSLWPYPRAWTAVILPLLVIVIVDGLLRRLPGRSLAPTGLLLGLEGFLRDPLEMFAGFPDLASPPPELFLRPFVLPVLFLLSLLIRPLRAAWRVLIFLVSLWLSVEFVLVFHFLMTDLLLAAGAVVLAASLRARSRPGLNALVAMWFLCCVAYASVRVARMSGLGRPPSSPAHRVVAHHAYDVLVTKSPAALEYTDNTTVHVISDPYSAHPGPETALDESGQDWDEVERLMPAAAPDMFYATVPPRGVIRVHVYPPGAGGDSLRLTTEPFYSDKYGPKYGHVLALAEDSTAGRLLILTEWNAILGEFDLGTGDFQRRLLLGGYWPIHWITLEPRTHAALISSTFSPGWLREINLDTGVFEKEVPRAFLYKTVLDQSRGLIWGVRYLSGQILAFDMKTLALRKKVEVKPLLRDIEVDPIAGQVFANTYPEGDLFRVDIDSERVVEHASCGHRCRNLFFDADRRVLWAASGDGVYRFAVDRPLSGE